MHSNPLTRGHAPLCNKRAKGRRKPATKARRRAILHFLWKPDEIDICIMYTYILRERAPVRKSGLELVIADLLIAGYALRTRSTTTHKRKRNPIALFPACHIFPNILNYAGEFMPWDMRQCNVRIMPHPPMPIAPTKPRCHYTNNYAVRGRCRVGHVLYREWAAKLIIYCCFHLDCTNVDICFLAFATNSCRPLLRRIYYNKQKQSKGRVRQPVLLHSFVNRYIKIAARWVARGRVSRLAFSLTV